MLSGIKNCSRLTLFFPQSQSFFQGAWFLQEENDIYKLLSGGWDPFVFLFPDDIGQEGCTLLWVLMYIQLCIFCISLDTAEARGPCPSMPSVPTQLLYTFSINASLLRTALGPCVRQAVYSRHGCSLLNIQAYLKGFKGSREIGLFVCLFVFPYWSPNQRLSCCI